MTDLEEETFFLEKHWNEHNSNILENYLVVGYHNPICNMQRVLKRHFLLEVLFGDKFKALQEEEIQNSIEIIRLLNEEEGRYLGINFGGSSSLLLEKAVPSQMWNEFQLRWAKALENENKARIKVLEPACGSANDYRFMALYGLSSFLEYRGFDLCYKNIENAQKNHQEKHAFFDVGNIFFIDAKDQSYDYLVVSHLFEHFSSAGIEKAAQEICRIARKKIYIDFFNIFHHQENEIIPKSYYHWNELSLKQMIKLFEKRVKKVTAISIYDFLSKRGLTDVRNKYTYTFILEL